MLLGELCSVRKGPGEEGGPAGRDALLLRCGAGFDPGDSHKGERRERASESCSLTPCMHATPHNDNIINNNPILMVFCCCLREILSTFK